VSTRTTIGSRFRLTSKPEKRLDSAEIDACLAHTVAKVDDPRPTHRD
jgi:hypothetical protein